MKNFNLKLISPKGVLYETDASSVSLPTPNGEITVLPGHEPVISLLSPGEIKISIANTEHVLVTEGGVAEIANNCVKILADSAEDLSSLDQLKIEESRKKAEHMLANATDDVDYADALAHLEKQLAKLNILKRRKKYK